MIKSKKIDIKKTKFSQINSQIKIDKLTTAEEMFEQLEMELKWYEKIKYSLRRCIRIVKDFYWNTKNFFKNIWYYRYFLKNDTAWQFDEMYEALLVKLKKLEYTFEFNAHTMDAPRMLKEVRMARILCERIIKDEYEIKNKVFPSLSLKRKIEHESYLYKQDRDMFWDIIKKREHCWWD